MLAITHTPQNIKNSLTVQEQSTQITIFNIVIRHTLAVFMYVLIPGMTCCVPDPCAFCCISLWHFCCCLTAPRPLSEIMTGKQEGLFCFLKRSKNGYSHGFLGFFFFWRGGIRVCFHWFLSVTLCTCVWLCLCCVHTVCLCLCLCVCMCIHMLCCCCLVLYNLVLLWSASSPNYMECSRGLYYE